jgi:hypothetical protein
MAAVAAHVAKSGKRCVDWLSDRRQESGLSDHSQKLDRIVAQAHRERAMREDSYRERALQMYPWVCGRCTREFNRDNLRELTVHHRDHNHDNNPPDGSNWELLCLYCHDREHSHYLDSDYVAGGVEASRGSAATHHPFANLAEILKSRK